MLRSDRLRPTLLALALFVWVGPADAGRKSVSLNVSRVELPETQLLDVGVQVFNPGLGNDLKAMEKSGVFPEVRKSEARYYAHHLRETLVGSGYWGAVRVVPIAAHNLDLMIGTAIVRSDGKWLELDVRAVDSRGELWLAKRFKGEADPRAYADDGAFTGDPHQSLLNEIANELTKQREKHKPDDYSQIRSVSAALFAADLAPTVFEGYITRDKKGRYAVARLPAADDPMAERVARIRERDAMLVDTLDEHYMTFAQQIETSYSNWRSYSYEEQVAYEALQSSAKKRKILGGIAILGGILASGNSRGEQAARDAAILGGIAAIQSGVQKSDEAKIHRAAIKELTQSFDAEMKPILVEVDNYTLRLTGSAEAQYQRWRDMLRDIFASEVGLPTDPNRIVPDVATSIDLNPTVDRP